MSVATTTTTSVSTPTPTPTPTPTSASTPASASGLVTPSSTPLETQSTVIISFKSSQTPVQSQATTLTDNAANKEEQSEQQLKDIEDGYSTPTNLLLSSNVLKKVASFSVERSSSTGNSSSSSSNIQSLPIGGEKDKEKDTTLTATSALLEQQTIAAGAGSRRGSSFVPEKLSFAAYEKFEGKSHEMFFGFPFPSLPPVVSSQAWQGIGEGKRSYLS